MPTSLLYHGFGLEYREGDVIFTLFQEEIQSPVAFCKILIRPTASSCCQLPSSLT